MMFRSLFAALALAGLLSACSGLSTAVDAVTSGDSEELGVILRSDLEEASRSAHVYEDVVAYTCYDKLIEVLDRHGEEGFFTDESKGAFSSFQKLRNARRLVEGEAGVEIRLACSALKEETKGRVGAVLGFVKSIF